MTAARTLVLLSGLQVDPGVWAQVQTGLADAVHVLTPGLPGLEPTATEPFSLTHAAQAVGAAITSSGVSSAAVCGVGLGAMIALQLAADQPELTDDLVLLTRQVQLSPLLMSLPAVVVRLLPATLVQRLGAGREQLLALLDQVRPVDAASLAATVQTRALVLCGARDSINRRASSSLAGALPHGELQLVAGAGPDWLRHSTHELTDALRDRLVH